MNHNVKDYLILKGDFDFAIPWIALMQVSNLMEKGNAYLRVNTTKKELMKYASQNFYHFI